MIWPFMKGLTRIQAYKQAALDKIDGCLKPDYVYWENGERWVLCYPNTVNEYVIRMLEHYPTFETQWRKDHKEEVAANQPTESKFDKWRNEAGEHRQATDKKLFPDVQPVAPNVPLDAHTHKPGQYCRGCHELNGTYDPALDPRRRFDGFDPAHRAPDVDRTKLKPGFVYDSTTGTATPFSVPKNINGVQVDADTFGRAMLAFLYPNQSGFTAHQQQTGRLSSNQPNLPPSQIVFSTRKLGKFLRNKLVLDRYGFRGRHNLACMSDAETERVAAYVSDFLIQPTT